MEGPRNLHAEDFGVKLVDPMPVFLALMLILAP